MGNKQIIVHFFSTKTRHLRKMYCLLANAIFGAKLVKMFEEAKFRCVKVQFFSGSVVNFFRMFIIFCGETRFKLVCFGMYRRMSLGV